MRRQWVAAVVLCTLLGGCAGASKEAQPVTLERAAGEKLVLHERTALSFKAGTSLAAIPAGASFDLVGRIAQGSVYRSPDTTLQVRSWNVHEAYLVVNEDSIVGVYLPYQRGFLAASHPVDLNKGGSSWRE